LTFCFENGTLLSAEGVMKSRNSGIQRYSPITHQAKWLGTPVIVLPVNHIYEDLGVLKQGKQWFY